MTDKLTSLRQFTTVVADTGDIAAMKLYQPQDATTNPSLILNAAQIPEYRKLIDEAVTWAKAQSNDRAQQVVDATDKLAVNIGLEILKLVPGRISTEVDARLSYDTEASIAKAKRLIKLYNDAGISNDRILIKLASTWQGIRAAEQLEKEGINCNLTLLVLLRTGACMCRSWRIPDFSVRGPYSGLVQSQHRQERVRGV